MHEFYRLGRKAALWSILISLGLGVAQFLGGWFGGSVALMSDAFHSLGDVLTSVAVYGALVWAQRPADAEHPYGHTRAEAVVGSNIALILVFLGIGVSWEAMQTLGNHSDPPEWYTLFVAATSILLKEGLYRYEIRIANQSGSAAVRASAWDHRLDALGSFAVLIGLALARWGGAEWHAADHIAALIVGLVIVWTGASLFWTSLHELMDRQADPETLEAIRREALAIPGVRGVEKVLVRKSGLEYLVDIHVEVDPQMSVRDSHDIGHAVKDRLREKVITVKDVLVHIEPAPGKVDQVGQRDRVDRASRDL
jgi:cation diffusion facilitator family transporter